MSNLRLEVTRIRIRTDNETGEATEDAVVKFLDFDKDAIEIEKLTGISRDKRVVELEETLRSKTDEWNKAHEDLTNEKDGVYMSLEASTNQLKTCDKHRKQLLKEVEQLKVLLEVHREASSDYDENIKQLQDQLTIVSAANEINIKTCDAKHKQINTMAKQCDGLKTKVNELTATLSMPKPADLRTIEKLNAEVDKLTLINQSLTS